MNRRHSRSATGGLLVAGGLAVLLVYALLAWIAIYNNAEPQQICGGPHRDIFFPPATVCGVGGATVRITSLAATVAGSVLLLLGLGLFVGGVTVLLRKSTRDRRQSSRVG
jgi:hypothetical protein